MSRKIRCGQYECGGTDVYRSVKDINVWWERDNQCFIVLAVVTSARKCQYARDFVSGCHLYCTEGVHFHCSEIYVLVGLSLVFFIFLSCRIVLVFQL